MNDALPAITIYTDGGCRPNPGPGGWAAVLIKKGTQPRDLSGGEPKTTNNRMELRAAIEGLKALDRGHRVRLVTDSQYLRRGITEWLVRWRANGWKTAAKKPVLNDDLWRELADELERHRVDWEWVKGHSGSRWNERADRLASEAIPRPPLPVDDPKAVHLFLGVAHSGKRNVGSWSALLTFSDSEKSLSGRLKGASANRMHIHGAVVGLAALKRPVRVHAYTVSDYLKDGATSWLGGWRSRNWHTRDGKKVAHVELWRKLDEQLHRHSVSWHVASRDELPPDLEAAKRLAKEALAEDS